VKICHTADWHLGNARSRIDPETGLNARLMDFYRCARFTIEDSIARGAELILHAGDVFNSPRPSPTERRLALEAFNPALIAHVPVIAIVGNHDMPRSPSERHALDSLKPARYFDSNLYIVDRPLIYNIFRLGDRIGVALRGVPYEPATLELQIACLPWPNASLLLADGAARKLEPGERNLLVRGKLMDILNGLAADLRPGIPSILLAHCSLDVAAAGAQDRLMMLGGEWTLNAAEIASLGFTYVALGHIHKPQCVAGGVVYYSGSPEACNHGEEGEAKSYLLIDIPPNDPEGIEIEQVPTPFRTFLTVDGDFGAPGQPTLADCEGAIVRIRIPQAAASQATEIRRQIEAAGALEITIEIERAEAERRAGALEVSAGMDVEAALRTWLAQRLELEPLADVLVAEGLAIDRSLQGAAE